MKGLNKKTEKFYEIRFNEILVDRVQSAHMEASAALSEELLATEDINNPTFNIKSDLVQLSEKVQSCLKREII